MEESSTKSEVVHYLVICVYTHVSMVTHSHPDTRSHWLGRQATQYPVLIYRILSDHMCRPGNLR